MSQITPQTRNAVNQARMNELSGKYAHLKLVKFPRIATRVSEILCIIIPILYFSPKSMVDNYLGGEFLSAILSIILLILSVVRHICRWDDNLISHRILIAKSVRSANRALEILNSQTATEEEAQEFLRSSADQSVEEISLFEGIDIETKQYAYREALKEIIPSQTNHAACPMCNQSVWKFVKGNCQLCGGNGRS